MQCLEGLQRIWVFRKNTGELYVLFLYHFPDCWYEITEWSGMQGEIIPCESVFPSPHLGTSRCAVAQQVDACREMEKIGTPLLRQDPAFPFMGVRGRRPIPPPVMLVPASVIHLVPTEMGVIISI